MCSALLNATTNTNHLKQRDSQHSMEAPLDISNGTELLGNSFCALPWQTFKTHNGIKRMPIIMYFHVLLYATESVVCMTSHNHDRGLEAIKTSTNLVDPTTIFSLVRLSITACVIQRLPFCACAPLKTLISVPLYDLCRESKGEKYSY